MGRYRFGLAIVVSLGLVSVAPQANGASGTPISTCGETVTTDAYLTADLFCQGADAVTVGANDITIDLKGFTLRGDLSFYRGISAEGFDGFTIQNGVVRSFDFSTG